METLSVRPLNAELAEKAMTELNENPKKIIEDLEALRTWLAKQPHINARKDDQFLITFLRGCKYSLERAKEKIDTFYTLRKAIPEMFHSRDVTPKVLEVLKLGLIVPLPTADDNTGARIFLFKPMAYDLIKISVWEFMKVCYMVQDMQLIDDDNLVVCGAIFVMDITGLTLGHVVHYTPSVIKKITSLLQEAYPIRLKGIHFINVSPIFDAILKVFYTFLSSKLRKRIFVHDSLDALQKYISKDLLPHEYGGNAGSVEPLVVKLTDKIMQRLEWFIEDEQYKTDESKRPGAPKTTETLFGTVGSFRTLDFD